MSRTKRGKKPCGWDYWGKRPLGYGAGGKDKAKEKQIGIQRERSINKRNTQKEIEQAFQDISDSLEDED